MKTFILILSLVVSTLALAQDISQLEKACESADGLACAKTAYHYRRSGDALKAYKYYEKGCALKDESACFNMSSLSPRDLYFKKLHSIMNFQNNNLLNCYTPGSQNKYSETQLKEKWYKANFIIHINPAGIADVVNVKTELSEVFVKCTQKLLKGIQFPKPEGIDPTYEYQLTIASKE